jgi:hypothetical protein
LCSSGSALAGPTSPSKRRMRPARRREYVTGFVELPSFSDLPGSEGFCFGGPTLASRRQAFSPTLVSRQQPVRSQLGAGQPKDQQMENIGQKTCQDYPPARCPLCGKPNNCAMAAGSTDNRNCWCCKLQFPLSLIARVPVGARNRACICRRCWEAEPQDEQAGERRGSAQGTN